RARALPLTRPGHTAVDSRIFIVSSRDEPVLHRAVLEFLELPSKNILIKRLHRFRIIRVNFKVSNAIHHMLLLLYAAQYSSWRRTQSIVKSRWSSSRPFGARSRKL